MKFKVTSKLLSLLFIMTSVMLFAGGDVEPPKGKAAIKTKQGKAVLTKKGTPVYIDQKGK